MSSFTTAPLPKFSRNALTVRDPPLHETHQNSPYSNKNEFLVKHEEAKLSEMVDATSQKQPQPPKGNILHISNIPSHVLHQIKRGLYNLFSKHGPIFQIIVKTKQTGKHFAFVDYPNVTDAEKALHISKTEVKKLQGRNLIVNYCEDPKKNEARKDQKCFLCLGTGHKAMKCPIKPQMIKKKFKQKKMEDDAQQDDEATNFASIQGKSWKIKQVEEISNQDSQYSEHEPEPEPNPWRDPDYLRFLKLKKMLLQKKLRKKITKSKNKKH